MLLPPDQQTVEGFAAAWPRISDRTGDAPMNNGTEQAMHAMGLLMAAMKAK